MNELLTKAVLTCSYAALLRSRIEKRPTDDASLARHGAELLLQRGEVDAPGLLRLERRQVLERLSDLLTASTLIRWQAELFQRVAELPGEVANPLFDLLTLYDPERGLDDDWAHRFAPKLVKSFRMGAILDWEYDEGILAVVRAKIMTRLGIDATRCFGSGLEVADPTPGATFMTSSGSYPTLYYLDPAGVPSSRVGWAVAPQFAGKEGWKTGVVYMVPRRLEVGTWALLSDPSRPPLTARFLRRLGARGAAGAEAAERTLALELDSTLGHEAGHLDEFLLAPERQAALARLLAPDPSGSAGGQPAAADDLRRVSWLYKSLGEIAAKGEEWRRGRSEIAAPLLGSAMAVHVIPELLTGPHSSPDFWDDYYRVSNTASLYADLSGKGEEHLEGLAAALRTRLDQYLASDDAARPGIAREASDWLLAQSIEALSAVREAVARLSPSAA